MSRQALLQRRWAWRLKTHTLGTCYLHSSDSTLHSSKSSIFFQRVRQRRSPLTGAVNLLSRMACKLSIPVSCL